MIEIKNATVIKGGQRLFENFSWRVQEGEHWVITGPNGSGKTTLLEIVSGAVHLPKGELSFSFIEGENWDERYAERRKKIHYIPAHAIQSLLSEAHGLYYQQRYYGIGDERTPRVRDVMGIAIDVISSKSLPQSLSVADLLDLEVTRLSNGQLKKVLLLKILLTGTPQLLLMDYPFEGLDFDSREDLCDYIDEMATTYGVQIVIVDHHHHLPRIINRRLTLNAFKITSEDDSTTGKEATFISSPVVPINDPQIRPAVVDIRNLRIQYQDHVVMDKFSWTVYQGERWALVGKNGAGKTTLFSMIFADHPMGYSQEIYLFGRRRGSGESIWDIKKRIAYLGPELFSYLAPGSISLSARDYIRSINKKLNENSLNSMVAHFNAVDFIDKPVRVLSSGQLQLMLIMNCFLTEKELLLLDEPFQFLDDAQRINLTTYLQSHLRSDSTLILITHYDKDLAEWTNHTKRI